MTEFQDHDDVQLELHEIAKIRKEFRRASLLVWPLVLLGNAALLSLVLLIVRWVFDETNLTVVTGITCAAYVCTAIGMAVGKQQRVIDRMEMHALTLHNEILITKAKVEEFSRLKGD